STGKVDPKNVIPNIAGSHLGTRSQREQMDLLRKINEMHLAKRGGNDNPLEARIGSLEMAFRMQSEAQEAFDISRERAAVRGRYGSGSFAEACLLARRLVERGVRVVQIFTGAGQPWDDHGNIQDHAVKARQVDRPIAALLEDLKAKGLLGETLVLWGGE